MLVPEYTSWQKVRASILILACSVPLPGERHVYCFSQWFTFAIITFAAFQLRSFGILAGLANKTITAEATSTTIGGGWPAERISMCVHRITYAFYSDNSIPLNAAYIKTGPRHKNIVSRHGGRESSFMYFLRKQILRAFGIFVGIKHGL